MFQSVCTGSKTGCVILGLISDNTTGETVALMLFNGVPCLVKL